MAVVGTVKHKNEGVEGFGYDVWDTVPEWKWEKVHRGQPWSNNHRMKDARTRRRQRSKRHYTPGTSRLIFWTTFIQLLETSGCIC